MDRIARFRRFHMAVALLTASVFAIGSPAFAAGPLTAIAGYEYFQGRSQSHGAFVSGVLDRGTMDALAQVARWDDSRWGEGTNLAAGAGVTLAGPLRARARVTRVLGASPMRMWIVRAGPELRFGDAAAVSFFYESARVDDGQPTNGAAVEGLVAVHPRVLGRFNASYARADASANAAALSVGATWRALPHLDLTTEAGWTEARGLSSEAFPAGTGGRSSGLPLLGANETGVPTTSTAATRERSPTVLLGARVVF